MLLRSNGDTNMAKTSAQRQQAYRAGRARAGRARAGDNGELRINTFVATSAALGLKRLAKHHGVTQRAMLERLIHDADKAVVAPMDDAEFERYLCGGV